jgi:hypothetical protein
LPTALGDRGIPPDAALEMQVRPRGEAGMIRLLLDIRWPADSTECHAHAEVHVPLRSALGHGWSGWPTYLVSLRLLRTLG